MPIKADDILIDCVNVSFAYDGMVVAENLNFTVRSGDYLCIIGENGAGKSTLMKGLLGLKSPQCGEIKLCGGLKTTEIGYLPQQTAVQKDFPASVFEVVLSGRLNKRGMKPFYSHKDKEAAYLNMERLGISGLRDRCYRELSGGQQQRVLLARALCASEKMLLLDEPVTGLDPAVTADMYKIISDINVEYGITIIMISHDIRSAAEYASNVLHINKKQLFFGTAEEYIKSEISDKFLNSKESL